MKNQVQLFNNSQFGEIRIIEENGKEYFCGKDVASTLGYQNTNKALKDHCRIDGVTNRYLGVQTGYKSDGTPAMQNVQLKFIDEGNLYRLITHSKLPDAEQFERWVFDEVLPSIRKTGEYKVKQEKNDLKAQMLKTREENVKVRKAQLMYRLSQEVNIPTYKAVLQSHITELLTGEMLLPLQNSTELHIRQEKSANGLGYRR